MPRKDGEVREDDVRLEQRAEAFRLHEMEGWSYRAIAQHQGITHTTAFADVEWYRRYLQNENPKTFEAWRIKISEKYKRQYELAEELFNTAASSFVQAQALKQMVELTQLEAQLFGVDKAITAPVPDEQPADNVIVWEET